MATGKLRIDRIITEADMRQTRKLVTEGYRVFKGLRRGRVVLMVNRAETILRFVDSEMGLHTLYAPEGEKFQLDGIINAMNRWTASISLDVLQGARKCPCKPEPGISLAKMEQAKRRKRRKVRRKKAA